jgi:hypothetical protein
MQALTAHFKLHERVEIAGSERSLYLFERI